MSNRKITGDRLALLQRGDILIEVHGTWFIMMWLTERPFYAR